MLEQLATSSSPLRPLLYPVNIVSRFLHFDRASVAVECAKFYIKTLVSAINVRKQPGFHILLKSIKSGI